MKKPFAPVSWRDLFVGASIANFLYVRPWGELLSFDRDRNALWLLVPPTPTHFIALILNVLLTAGILAFVISRLRRNHRVAQWTLALASLVYFGIVLNGLRSVVPFVERNSTVIVAVFVVLFALAVVLRRPGTSRFLYGLFLVLSPFVLVNFARAAHRIATYDARRTAEPTLAHRLPVEPDSPRVVWMIFDEWDEPLTFADRRPGMLLPELDRMVREGLKATDATTPHMWTDRSMPSLINGVRVEKIAAEGRSELRIRPQGEEDWGRWSQQPHVFNRARAHGVNSAVIGWAVPYCRILSNSLCECAWWNASNQYTSMGTSFVDLFINQTRSLFETQYRSPFGMSLSAQYHGRVYDQMIESALKVAADPDLRLILLHFPIPHAPYFYNSATDRYDLRSRPILDALAPSQHGYLDALLLVDRTIGRVRRTLEEADLWNNTTMILSADHPFRHRRALDDKPVVENIPFIVKAAGHASPVVYGGTFNATLTADLILALLTREVGEPEEIADWLDERRDDKAE